MIKVTSEEIGDLAMRLKLVARGGALQEGARSAADQAADSLIRLTEHFSDKIEAAEIDAATQMNRRIK